MKKDKQVNSKQFIKVEVELKHLKTHPIKNFVYPHCFDNE